MSELRDLKVQGPLQFLNLRNNQLSDLGALLEFSFSPGAQLFIEGNSLDCEQQAPVLLELQARSIQLRSDC